MNRKKRSYEKYQLDEKQKICPSCGGHLIQMDPYTIQCTSCQQEYYISINRTHKISMRLSAGKLLVLCTLGTAFLIGFLVIGYQYYTGRLVMSASRFSVVFRDFLMEAYDKPIADIGKEDLDRMKYLKIEKEKGYRFTYSFEDSDYDNDKKQYEGKMQSITVKGTKDEFSPSNLQYFTGLTQIELYVDGWENYSLPQDNKIRSIICTDGLSRYGTPQFFTRVNPDTLEEVKILEAEELEDFSFLKYLSKIKRLSLEKAEIKKGDLLDGCLELEELSLIYVVMEEKDAYDIIKGFLSLPSLNRFYIEGKSAWYLTEEQWDQLRQEYGDRIQLIRN
ncbi:MAG: hypothetical protein HFG49_02615 [Lachnospiraceae bacterium]|jgi:hypothetical protein|nr:hypothetical protein [Lachnospiraceae bacterium]